MAPTKTDQGTADVLDYLLDRVSEREEGEQDAFRETVRELRGGGEPEEGARAPVDRSSGTVAPTDPAQLSAMREQELNDRIANLERELQNRETGTAPAPSQAKSSKSSAKSGARTTTRPRTRK